MNSFFGSDMSRVPRIGSGRVPTAKARPSQRGGYRGARASPRSHHSPAIMAKPSSTSRFNRCSSGACWQHELYECGSHRVSSPRDPTSSEISIKIFRMTPRPPSRTDRRQGQQTDQMLAFVVRRTAPIARPCPRPVCSTGQHNIRCSAPHGLGPNTQRVDLMRVCLPSGILS